jgi:ubiquinone/menaquinone biosynthesis C-methylase UbiE
MANVLQDDFSKLEHDTWTQVTGLYDKSWANLTKQFIEPLLDATGIRQGMRVLDVACGPGYVSKAIHARNAIPTGVDFSSSMIRLAKEFYPDIQFVEGDAQALNFSDNEFDAVVMNFGMLHLAKPELGMAEARRVLKPRGGFGFTVWAGPDRSPTAEVMFNNIMKYAREDVNMPEAPPNYYFSDQKLTTEVLERIGFDNVTFTDHLIEWVVPTAEYYFNTELNAGVRSGTFLRRQTPETLSLIKQAIVEGMQQFYDGTGYRLKFCGCVFAATKRS